MHQLFGGAPRPGGPAAGPDAARVAQQARAAQLLDAIVLARRTRTPVHAFLREELGALEPTAVHAAAEVMLLEACAVAWTRGWQPAELVRRGRLECAGSGAGAVVELAVANDHVGRRSTTLHPRWVAQVASLDLPAANGEPGWVARWVAGCGLAAARVPVALGEAVAAVTALRELPTLLPPPGRPDATDDVPVDAYVGVHEGDTGDPLLQRIRNLLAKAESSTFEAEALAFTAKAQELMTRHAIDAARVHGARRAGERPLAIRIPVDAPYADVKATLLAVVAEATRCRTVLLPDVGLATVLGFPDDVAGVEALFTSLLVQAQRALTDAGGRRGATVDTSPAGTRAFRSSFLHAFTARIQERLEESNAAVVAAAVAEASGDAFLPVLQSRRAAVEEFVEEQFRNLRPLRTRHHYDPAGWSSGRAAADRAQLARGDVAGPRPRLGPG